MPERRRSGTRRRIAVAIVASVGVAALAATGVTYASASSPVPQSAPAVQDNAVSAPFGGDGQTHFDPNGNHNNNHDDDQVHVNERTYSAVPGRCTAVVSSPAMSFNVRNDSNKTIEFFRGITCDNGAAISTIAPHSSSNGLEGTTVIDGTTVPFALLGSFRVLEKHRH